jgi:hypothetical protein
MAETLGEDQALFERRFSYINASRRLDIITIKWTIKLWLLVKTLLIPISPSISALVIDKASYYIMPTRKPLTTKVKEEMKVRLLERIVMFCDMYDQIK